MSVPSITTWQIFFRSEDMVKIDAEYDTDWGLARYDPDRYAFRFLH
jgi:hypothetical protein